MRSWGYPKYVSVAEKRARAEKKLKQLLKKNPGLKPVSIKGRQLAHSWWGKSWNRNLERYADYENRIGRGRSYVRHGAVLDLQIKSGKITALVHGSQAKPYQVDITISPIAKSVWRQMMQACRGKIDTLQTLLAGQFPKALGDVFMTQGQGLFPTPEHIKFSCSCPDWADMCKHVAATLYGVGARLDQEPALLFTLRQADMHELVAQTVADTTQQLLEPAMQIAEDVLADDNLSDLFGIDLGTADSNEAGTAKLPKTSAAPKKPRKRPRTQKASTRKPASAKKTTPVSPQPNPRGTPDASHRALSAAEQVARIILANDKGIGIAALKAQTGFNERKLYNIVYRLKKQQMITTVSNGIYKGL